ncbi:hypothetical protein [Micromonospora sp. DT233]|uniref:hypothetical protein n=1 Tax=Micromonospora sp. DT233 TaxID=3393432 RepID=UPI003CF2772C
MIRASWAASGVPLAGVVPLADRVGRTAVGSLAGQVDLSGDWDSARSNAEVAADFGLGAGSAYASTSTIRATGPGTA